LTPGWATTLERATRGPGAPGRLLEAGTAIVSGSRVGIDVRKVVDTGIEPLITTGDRAPRAGIGQIGAGLTRAPMACFTGALDAFEPPLAEAA